jgi:hypothetical protein
MATLTQLDTIKARQRDTWASGDFGIIGTTLQIVGESLCEAVDLRAGSKVLDVAAGNGNARWPPHDDGATSCPPITFRRCSKMGAVGQRASACRWSFALPMRKTCHSATIRLTWCSRHSV